MKQTRIALYYCEMWSKRKVHWGKGSVQ